ncbi:MAG: Molybdopterin biosynthesis enzyme MoaB [Chloroflexi bacterium]|jgi:molybdenum cofactor synthesis domain-containing protein|nr:MAG: Molybdopterin biosynthesis enzyme MoaB [Chloroflexota bacterium]
MDVFSSKGFVVEKYEVVPDERHVIEEVLRTWVDTENLDLIVTTGGTGLTKRDVTPEATLAIIDREVPGIAEAMRIRTMDITPLSVLSRSVAGVREDTLIINMPGSPKAVQECLDVLMPVIPHALGLLKDPPISHDS